MLKPIWKKVVCKTTSLDLGVGSVSPEAALQPMISCAGRTPVFTMFVRTSTVTSLTGTLGVALAPPAAEASTAEDPTAAEELAIELDDGLEKRKELLEDERDCCYDEISSNGGGDVCATEAEREEEDEGEVNGHSGGGAY